MEAGDKCNSVIRIMGRTGLGRICNVEIRYQVSSMSEFECGDPFGFVFSVFIL